MSEFWIHLLVLKVTAACEAVFSNITNKVVSDLLDLLNIAAPIYISESKLRACWFDVGVIQPLTLTSTDLTCPSAPGNVLATPY